jgi:hypothetical protein
MRGGCLYRHRFFAGRRAFIERSQSSAKTHPPLTCYSLRSSNYFFDFGPSGTSPGRKVPSPIEQHPDYRGYCALKSTRWISSPVLLSGLAATVTEPAGAPSGLVCAWPISACGSWNSDSSTSCLLFTVLLNIVVIACGTRPHHDSRRFPRSCRYTSARAPSRRRGRPRRQVDGPFRGHLVRCSDTHTPIRRAPGVPRSPTAGSRNPPACTPLYDSGEKTRAHHRFW